MTTEPTTENDPEHDGGDRPPLEPGELSPAMKTAKKAILGHLKTPWHEMPMLELPYVFTDPPKETDPMPQDPEPTRHTMITATVEVTAPNAPSAMVRLNAALSDLVATNGATYTSLSASIPPTHNDEETE